MKKMYNEGGSLSGSPLFPSTSKWETGTRWSQAVCAVSSPHELYLLSTPGLLATLGSSRSFRVVRSSLKHQPSVRGDAVPLQRLVA